MERQAPSASAKPSGPPSGLVALTSARGTSRTRGAEPTYVQRLLNDYRELVRSQRRDG